MRWGPNDVTPGELEWDPDNPGVGYRRRKDGGGGKWVIRPTITMPDGSKRRVPETLENCPNRIQALDMLRVRQGQDFQGTYTFKVRVPTVDDFTEPFLRAKRDLATVSKYRSQLRKHLSPFFGPMSLAIITTAHCEEYRKRRDAAGAKPATVRSELRCLQSMFVEARKAEICDRDPVRDVTFGRIDNARERVASDDELGRLVAEADRRHDLARMLFWVFHFTGMRTSHALRLRWKDIDEGREVILTKPDKDGKRVAIPIPARLMAEFRYWQQHAPPSPWVFPARNDHKKHRTRHGIAGKWAAFLRAAGVSGLTRHDLRRTLISELVADGASYKQVQSVTGQRSDATVKRYEQPPLDLLRERLERRDPSRSTGDPHGE